MKRLLVVLLVQLFLFSTLSAQVFSDAQIAEFEQFVKQQMEADRIPGMSIGFMKDGKIWAKGFGFADLENKSPAKTETMYRLASVAKPMTAMAVLKLVDDGKIDLDAEIQTYVPYFPKKKYPVTVRLLLGHLAGISHYKDYDKEGHFKEKMDTKQSLAVFQDFELVAEPGTSYNYSSYGYNLLGAVIEGASGMSYGEYLRKYVWNPLEMNTIRMDDLREIIPNRTKGYTFEQGGLRNSETIDISSRFAAGGTRATVTDVLRFGKGVIDQKILTKKTGALMTESMATKDGVMTFYGAGLGTYPVNGRYTLQHSGAQAETSTQLMIFPTRDLVIVVAINLEGANRIPYAAKLFELVTNERWTTNVYINDGDEKVPLYNAMQSVFEQGRAKFEKTGGKDESDSAKTTEAFKNFNFFLNRNTLTAAKRDDLSQEIAQTRSGKNGPFEQIGFYMAKRIAEKKNPAQMREYSNTGAIAFFDDYMRLDVPAEYRLNDSVREIVRNWRESWNRTNADSLRSLSLNSSTDFVALSVELTKLFAKESVYPNLSTEIVDMLEPMAVAGKAEQVLSAAKLAAELYPGLEPTNSNYGFYLVLYGQRDAGIPFLRKGASMNVNGLAGAIGLNKIAKDVFDFGLTDEALRVLDAAFEVHPNAAVLRDTAARIYKTKGDKEKALFYFRKVLELEPNYAGSDAVKIEIEKLK